MHDSSRAAAASSRSLTVSGRKSVAVSLWIHHGTVAGGKAPKGFDVFLLCINDTFTTRPVDTCLIIDSGQTTTSMLLFRCLSLL